MDEPKRMTSLDRKIEAARQRAEAERKTQAVPQSQPTEGLTHLMSTENCNVANQRKPAHGGRVAVEAVASAGSADPAPVFVVSHGPAAETVADIIVLELEPAAGTQPSPEQIKAAIQERERTEAQLRATWEPGQKMGNTTQFRREHLNRDPITLEQRALAGKAFSDGIAANLTRPTPLMEMAKAAEQRVKLANQITVFLAWLANHPEAHEAVVQRMRDQGVIPHEAASLPPQTHRLMRFELPPPGNKLAALGPGGLRFVIERSDTSVYLAVDGPDV